MEWMKWQSAAEGGDASMPVRKVYYADPDRNLLTFPAQELVLEEGQDNAPSRALSRIAEDQCAVLTDGDKSLSFCAEKGEYAFCKADEEQNWQVYFVRLDTFSSQVFSTHTPIPYPVKHKESEISGTVHLRCVGCYSYRIADPQIFWQAIGGKCSINSSRQTLESEMDSIFSACLPGVFRQLSEEGIPYTDVASQTERITELMKEKLASAWKDSRGIELTEYAIFLAEANREEEEAFRLRCQQEKEKKKTASRTESGNPSGEPFSEEWNEAINEISRSAEEAFSMLQGGITSLLSGFMGAIEKGLDSTEVNGSVTSSASGVKRSLHLLGTWECLELKQTAIFALMDACILMNGQEIWRGNWKELPGADGADAVITSDDEKMGGYTCFEYHKASDSADGEYLAAVFADTDMGKQYIRFTKTKGIFEIR